MKKSYANKHRSFAPARARRSENFSFNNSVGTSPFKKRQLGFFSIIAVVVGAQLGTAMFLLPSQLSPYGIWSLVSWVVTGIGALSLCHIFSALAHYSAREGGPHVYVSEAFGKRPAFYVGWSYWVISWLSSLPVLVLAMTSLESLIGGLGPWGRLMGEGFLLGLIMILNLRGTALSGLGEIIFSTLKVVPLLIIPFLSLACWKGGYLMAPAVHSPLTSLNAASLLTFWGFVGLEAGTTLSNCVRNASVVVPRALFWGTSLVILVYVLNTMAVMAVIPPGTLRLTTNPYELLLIAIGGAWWGKIVSLLIFIVCLGTLNSWLLASGQIAMIAAKEKLFPSLFGKVNTYQSPMMGIILTTLALLAGVILIQSKTIHQQINGLINFSTTLFIAIYMVTALALIKFIFDRKIASRPFLWISLGIGLAFCVWSIVTTSPSILAGSLIIPFIGWALAWIFKWPVK